MFAELLLEVGQLEPGSKQVSGMMRRMPMRRGTIAARCQIGHHCPHDLRRIENRAMAEALVLLQLDVRTEFGNRLGIVEGHFAIAAPVNDEGRGLHGLQELDCGEGADRTVPNTFQMVLIGALRCRCQTQLTTEVTCNVAKAIRAADENKSRDRVRVRQWRAAFSNQQGNEAAEGMRNRCIDWAIGVTYAEHGARAFGEVRASPGARPVCGKVKQQHANAGPAQRLDEGRHKGGFTCPAVHENNGAAGVFVRVKHVTLNNAGRRCDLLPICVAKVVTCALRQVMMIARSILGLFRRAENAKCKVPCFGGR